MTIRRGTRVGFLAGPFRTHGLALAMVEYASWTAENVDDMAFWDQFGTMHNPISHRTVGVLNERLGVELDGDGYVVEGFEWWCPRNDTRVVRPQTCPQPVENLDIAMAVR